MGALNVFTYSLSGGTMTIDAIDNVFRVSVLCSSGDVSVQGGEIFKGLNPSPIVFATGQGITITSENASLPLDNFTIDATSGVADLVISYQ